MDDSDLSLSSTKSSTESQVEATNLIYGIELSDIRQVTIQTSILDALSSMHYPSKIIKGVYRSTQRDNCISRRRLIHSTKTTEARILKSHNEQGDHYTLVQKCEASQKHSHRISRALTKLIAMVNT